MTKAPIHLQDLRRRLYVKAKAEPTWRFWGLYAHVCKRETLWEAYQLAKENHGAPGVDGVTFRRSKLRAWRGFSNSFARSWRSGDIDLDGYGRWGYRRKGERFANFRFLAFATEWSRER